MGGCPFFSMFQFECTSRWCLLGHGVLTNDLYVLGFFRTVRPPPYTLVGPSGTGFPYGQGWPFPVPLELRGFFARFIILSVFDPREKNK